jgi:hypothetical protein
MASIPGLGELDEDGDFLASVEVRIPCMRNREVQFLFEEPDVAAEPAVHAMIARFLAADPSALQPAEPFIRQYRDDMLRLAGEKATPIKDIWRDVTLPDEVHVHFDDGIAYLSLECNVEWEQEHGMQLVLDGDLRIVKVGPFNGHLTNEHAYGDPKLAGVVYRARR